MIARLFAIALVSCVSLVAVCALVACRDADPSAEASGLPCDVDEVLARRCRECHSDPPRYGAPMPLLRHGDLLATARSGNHGKARVLDRVSARIHDRTERMPPPPKAELDPADAAILDAWIAARAPRSEATCAASHDVKPAPPAPRSSCPPDVHVRPAQPYASNGDVDDQLVCYGFETHRSSKRHIVGFAPAIESESVLHHITILQSDVAVSPIPTACSPDAMSAWRPLYGWAPGAAGLDLPPQAGFPDEPGSHYVVQLHYANPSRKRILDSSGFDLCTTEQLRPNDADVYAFGTMEITVPARGSLTRNCSVAVPEDGATTHLFAAFPHMHKLGRSIRNVVRAGGTGPEIDLGTVESWSLSNQSWLPLDTTLHPGDVVRTTCSWSNTTESAVGYGPTADDEMCFSYVMYFPKIQTPNWHWSLPALYSTCN